jgi:hypothetical protein
VTAAFNPSTLAAPGSGTSTLTLSATASAAAGSYTVTILGSGGGITRTVAVQMSVTGTPPPSSSYTLFSPSAVPANGVSMGTPLELGMKFTSDSSGSITGIRFYKVANDPGPHVGTLWSGSGQKLGSVTFSNETSTGWQQANFSTPVAISANTVYVVSYSSPYGSFTYNDNFFISTVDNPPLHAPASTTGNGNGVYAYGTGVFPTGSNFARNYWVDVVFAPGTATAAHSATLSWTGSTSGVAGYNVYRATRSGGPYTVLNPAPQPGSSYTDPSVQAGNTYYYVVTAVDSSGTESANSNEVTAAVPA